MKAGRRLGFDYGDVRIGVALSDLSGLLATPHGFLRNSEDLLSQCREIISEFEPIYIAVGIPHHLSGAQSAKMQSVEKFINLLEENFNIPVIRIDERFSTVSASKNLREAGKDSRKSKGFIDSAAAATILEMALTQERNSENR